LGKLANIPKFDKAFWKHIGDEITDDIRVQTQVKGKDVFNKNFKSYSRGYANRKPKLKRGGTGLGSKVNLTLTGDMMNGLQTRGFSSDSVTIGWSGTNAKKIQWNDDMGRAVTTNSKPLSNKSIKIVQKLAGRKIKVNADKETAKPINFKIGK
tara:strand:- start:678 stop:1136 length:459 start_codon:yes stop_codon:yes gene_type:complete